MEIKTKFNVCDSVYFLFENKIHSNTIERIVITVNAFGGPTNKGNIIIFYYFPNSNSFYRRESDVFASREDLLQSL